MDRADGLGHPADWLIRAQHNRNLAEGGKLWDKGEASKVLGEIAVNIWSGFSFVRGALHSPVALDDAGACAALLNAADTAPSCDPHACLVLVGSSHCQHQPIDSLDHPACRVYPPLERISPLRQFSARLTKSHKMLLR
jgi:hypothetical protein